MVSKTAQADVEDMWEAGLKPTVSDIVRLNALGLILENSSRPTEGMYYLRRCAWLGDVVLKEPLLAHEVWLGETRRCVSEDWLSQLAMRAYICYVSPEDLPPSDQPDAIRAAVDAFVPKLAGFTQAQIAAAVMYATVGDDWRTDEDAPPKNTRSGEYIHFGPEFCSAIGVIYNGVAVNAGLTIADAMNLPRHTLEAIVERHLRFESAYDMKRVHSDAEDDYLRAYDQITARLKGTKDNG